MKITDIFTLYQRENPPPPAGRAAGIRPVSEVDKVSLQPGQLFRGEVLGEDGKGNLLLKVGGEIITTGSLVAMETGQKVWVEVKTVGDSPLFALASAKGAIHDLLKNIMEIRPALLAQGKTETTVPPEFQTPLESGQGVSFVPKLAPLQSDGTIPRETQQLFKALLALPKADIPPLSESKMQELQPFLSQKTGKVDLRQVVSVLSQTGKIAPVLSEFKSLRSLFVFPDSARQQEGVLPQSQAEGRPVAMEKGGRLPVETSGDVGKSFTPSATVPVITADGQVAAHAVQVVRGLVDSLPLLSQSAVTQGQPAMETLTKEFTVLLRAILTAGRIPKRFQSLEPIRQLMQADAPPLVGSGSSLRAMTAVEMVQSFAETSISGPSLSPVQHNETVAKVLSGLQGGEPKPELLRTLKQLLMASHPMASIEGEDDVGVVKHSTKINETTIGLTKVASFFSSQVIVNQEVAHVTQGNCVLIPCFFAGQTGWGEWIWSHEQEREGQENTSENLAFFLEMSNLGPVSIQAILGERTVSGQFRVADDNAYKSLLQALPKLEERLNALGYKAQLTCQQKPVAIIQEIKDSLESRTTGSSPSSLVDVRA